VFLGYEEEEEEKEVAVGSDLRGRSEAAWFMYP
jgi:hypothetical protein